MDWSYFIYFAMAAVLLWGVGAWAAWKEKTGMAYTTTVLGLLVFFSFILSMWISLERPVDSVVLDSSRHGVHLCEPVQAGDSRQDADARTPKPLVRPSRHRLYVRLRRAGCSYSDGHLSAIL